MPSFCVVLNCCDKYGHSDSTSFHKFPLKRKDLLQHWTDFTQRGPDWKPTKWSAICSQHFTAEDFNCAISRKMLKKTAIPSIRGERRPQVNVDDEVATEEAVGATIETVGSLPEIVETESKQRTPEKKRQQEHNQTAMEHIGYENNEGVEIPAEPQNISIPGGPKINCRLCGIFSSAAGTFSTNFELFGMIQKCFPTLNIQQDDNLPKDLCYTCLNRLQSFAEFVDKVLEAQRELQQKYRTEKPTSKQLLETRPLKIKQEPVVVKVKQEIAEGFDNFLSDELDVGLEECCEAEQDASSVDQKFGFCDFPILNAQDIIDNCDIMEIINLDDPFINIPDDDAATISAADHVASKLHTPTAHQLLQTHMLIDEHNYSSPAEDLKEEWQIKQCCKTEETELYEQLEIPEAAAGAEEEYQQNCMHAENMYATSEQLKSFTNSADNERSARPIVTSVSAIAESRLQLHSNMETEATSFSSNKLVVTSISDLLPGTSLTSAETNRQKDNVPNSKPNIVVLNESIVKSTEAFQLHACAVCQLKFFSIESLQQHVNFTHMITADMTAAASDVPMVILPVDKLVPCSESNKQEVHRSASSENQLLTSSKTSTPKDLSEQLKNLKSWQLNMKTLQLNALINNWTQANTPYKNSEVIQQDNSKQHNVTINVPQEAEQHKATQSSNVMESLEDKSKLCSAKNSNRTPVGQDIKTQTNTLLPRQRNFIDSPKHKSKGKARQHPNVIKTAVASLTKTSRNPKSMKQHIAVNYKFLQRRYHQLLRKCKALAENCHYYAKGNILLSTYNCSHCDNNFSSIYQLLQHKQHYHRAPKLHTAFFASCHGCERFFLSKQALSNHMRYICQSLSLRWLKTHLQTFKCRSCRSISFTHWRLFRNHEISCKRKIQLRKLYKCSFCPRDFVHAYTLELHMSSRHHAVWNMICTQCNNQFQQVHEVMKHHDKGVCKVSSSSDCAVICCTCRRYFQKLKKLLAHHRCLKNKHTQLVPKAVKFMCNICHKVFASNNSLSQHRITHTQEKRHKCDLCARVFKRRGGLTQHMKGFHLQLKPYECSVCKYRYALKCDMNRCRHSTLHKRSIAEEPGDSVGVFEE